MSCVQRWNLERPAVVEVAAGPGVNAGVGLEGWRTGGEAVGGRGGIFPRSKFVIPTTVYDLTNIIS